jgi:hypothetical protein
MAIHPDYPGLTVEVVVDDLTLTEYIDDTEAPPTDTVVKYIEAVSGANFAIRFVVANSCFANVASWQISRSMASLCTEPLAGKISKDVLIGSI